MTEEELDDLALWMVEGDTQEKRDAYVHWLAHEATFTDLGTEYAKTLEAPITLKMWSDLHRECWADVMATRA